MHPVQVSATPAPHLDITALILAGGQGTRLGGVDKGWVEWRGRPLIVRQLDALSPQVAHVLISANRNLDRYRALGVPVITDTTHAGAGPLAGIHNACTVLATPYLLVVPVDAADPPPDLALRLHDSLLRNRAEVVIAHDGARMQTLHCLLCRTLASALARYLDGGARKAEDFLLGRAHAFADFSDTPSAFRNLNRPEDL